MMKAVKSIYGKHEEIVVLFEFERVADVMCDGVTLAGDVVALGQFSEEIPVLLVLNEHEKVMFEITLGVITKYEKWLETVKDDMENEGTVTNYLIEYYSTEDRFSECHYLTMCDADPCWE